MGEAGLWIIIMQQAPATILSKTRKRIDTRRFVTRLFMKTEKQDCLKDISITRLFDIQTFPKPMF